MSFRLAISATFTAEPIEPVLTFWGLKLQSPIDVRFAPYNQVAQTLLDPSGEFAANRQGVNILFVRVEDLGRFENFDLARIEENLQHLIGLVRETPARLSVPLLFTLCPPSPAFIADAERLQFAHKLSRRVETMLEGTPGVVTLTHQEIERLYPVPAPHNAEGDRLGAIPYTDLYFTALGTAALRIAHGLLMQPFKVIALDCDNTLWRGICGEDGPRGIVVDPNRRWLQQFMVEQREQGMLLALDSKNNERDVLETFEQNPDMPLELRHFAARRLNWEPKGANLADLANELSLGIDSFVFVDDNPKECAEVSESVPEALALTLPESEAGIAPFLRHVWAFDHVVVTEEDRHRNAYYAQAQEFGRELKKAASLEHFVHSLDLRVTFDELRQETLPRASQLTQRTNQFNFTTIRRTEQELGALAEEGLECHTLTVSDRFGDYGLTGLVIFRPCPQALEIDTLLLSCRVLGRGVEHRVVAHLAREALRRGIPAISARLRATTKNEPARQFLHEIGAACEQTTHDGFVCLLPAGEISDLRFKPARAALPPASEKTSPKKGASRKRPDYQEIANTLATAEDILGAIRGASGHVDDPSMSETELRLSSIWADLLKVSSIRAEDNFFDLGGHSLLVVLLIVRVRESFGVELAIDDVYSATLTLRGLAEKIEAHQLGDPAAFDAILKELEGLPDEEIERLLAEEQR